MSRELVEISALAEPESAGDDEFVKRVLRRCARHECVFHEEKTFRSGGIYPLFNPESRFTILLPDTRIVSSLRYEQRREALSAICRAVKPYLDNFEAERPAPQWLQPQKLKT